MMDGPQGAIYCKFMQVRERSELRFLFFNAENFFLYIDQLPEKNLLELSEGDWQRLSATTQPNKPLSKIIAIRDLIRNLDPDFILLNEIGGKESLEHFARLFLEDSHRGFIIEGNSPRGIDVGYLVKDFSDLKYIHLSHKNRPIGFLYPHELERPPQESHFFSRDVSELRIFRHGENSPALILLLTHLKSKLDPRYIDAEGRNRRAAELRTLVEIYNEVRAETDNKVPVIVAGDFNGKASRDNPEPEFELIYEATELLDSLEVAGISQDLRTTQIQFLRNGQIKNIQLDYVFLSPDLHELVVKEQTYVHTFSRELALPIERPRSLTERSLLPSDHYPVVVTTENFLKKI